jgi:hypothetical protein
MLDSKNHAIRPLSVEDFVENGKAIVHENDYVGGNYFFSCFINAFKFVGLEGSRERFMNYPSTTPYVLDTHIVQECMNRANYQDANFPFAHWYEPINLPVEHENVTTEFALYAAMCELFGNKNVIIKPSIYRTLFAGWPKTDEMIFEYINFMGAEEIKFFAIHRLAYSALREQHKLKIAEYWKSAGLFSSVNKAIEFMNGNQNRFEIP